MATDHALAAQMTIPARVEALKRLRQQVSQGSQGRLVIGAGAGTGISAKFSERAGVDLIIIEEGARAMAKAGGDMQVPHKVIEEQARRFKSGRL